MDRLVVTDFNGTCFGYSDELAMNRHIVYAVVDDLMHGLKRGRLWRLPELAGLLKAKIKVGRRLRGYYDGKRHIWEVYEPFNELVLRGRAVALINAAVGEFARMNKDKVDGRILRPMRVVKGAGMGTGVLSAAYKNEIITVLQEAGFGDVFSVEDVVANDLIERDGRAVGFALGIYERKRETMEEEFFRKRGFRPEATLYIGDSIRYDGPIAEMLPKGYFVVPFLATDEAREALSKKYGAHVPQDERDMERYLLTR